MRVRIACSMEREKTGVEYHSQRPQRGKQGSASLRTFLEQGRQIWRLLAVAWELRSLWLRVL